MCITCYGWYTFLNTIKISFGKSFFFRQHIIYDHKYLETHPFPIFCTFQNSNVMIFHTTRNCKDFMTINILNIITCFLDCTILFCSFSCYSLIILFLAFHFEIDFKTFLIRILKTLPTEVKCTPSDLFIEIITIFELCTL